MGDSDSPLVINLVTEDFNNKGRGEKLRRLLDRLELFRRIRFHVEVLEAGGILRRYFVMNGFDGILTVTGIVMGAYITNALNPIFVVGASMGASIAMGVSGFVGAFMTERAERIKEIKELEKNLFTSLDNSFLKHAVNTVTFLAAIIDALAPLVFSIIGVSPFFLAVLSIITPMTAFYASLVVISMLLFLLGFILARISGEHPLKYGFYMLLSGLLVSILGFLLGGVI
ncbi:MAG: hypothetical protein DRJ47_06860 [Thermoprotei archaeon]|nr:MAG: hypothetical protein DRJ47_06860 [Thermoprotei archaeon]